MTKLGIFILILGMTGCSTIGDYALFAGTTGSNRFDKEDVEQAIVIAQQNKDTVGEACYKAIRSSLDRPEPETKGPVSAYATARIGARLSRLWAENDVHIACSPLITDAASFLARFKSAILGLP